MIQETFTDLYTSRFQVPCIGTECTGRQRRGIGRDMFALVSGNLGPGVLGLHDSDYASAVAVPGRLGLLPARPRHCQVIQATAQDPQEAALA